MEKVYLDSAPTWQQVVEDCPPILDVDREAGECTKKDLARMLGITDKRAEQWAKDRTKAGVLIQLERYDEGRICNAWRPAPDACRDNAA